MRALCASVVVGIAALASPAKASVSEPEPRPDEAFDFMNLLAQHGLHDLKDERWNAYGQLTYISSWKPSFAARYTNANGSTASLSPEAERSFTGTATLYLGAALWRGAEAYLVPEVISERPLSNLTGLGGVIQNFELQKTGAETPTLYRSRAYVRQTIDVGGKRVEKSSDPMQLGAVTGSHRVVLTVGNFSILDFFDKNSFSGDLRRQFFNMAFLTYAAYDFAADARGYAWGGLAEYYHDDWAFRIGRITPPEHPNQLPIDFRIWKYYGDQLEIEHTHELFGQPGAVRVLGYRNRENMGRFDDAIAAVRRDPGKNADACTEFNYGSHNASAPDLCWARKGNVKMGVGLNLEQRLPGDVGLFFRGMISDGASEVYSYTSTDRSISLGALAKGTLWRRADDLVGIGYAQGWISRSHADYLAMGGVDGFIGDGRLTQASEHVLEAFYSVNVWKTVSLSGDYQRIWNPAYNADRGPLSIFGARAHAEF